MAQFEAPEENVLQQSFALAQARERAQWERVKGRYPGQPGHDPQAWTQWLDAARAFKDATATLRAAARMQGQRSMR